jgi:lipoyl(octanoyl) transferase
MIQYLYLGRVEYGEALCLQQELVALRTAGRIGNVLLLLEHPPVLTLGRNASRSNILASDEILAARGVTLHEINRGGDVTYHGPGQLVGYPIFDLGPTPDVGLYLRNLEGCLIDVLADFGIAAGRLSGYTGVWIGDRKIVAIGVKVSQGVTTHGFALNVSTDLSLFTHILACGIPNKGVTSMALELGAAPPMTAVEDAVVAQFSERFALSGTPAAHVA